MLSIKRITSAIAITLILSNSITAVALADDLKPSKEMLDIEKNFTNSLNNLKNEGYGQKHELKAPEIKLGELPSFKGNTAQDLHNSIFNMQDKTLDVKSIIPSDSFFSSFLDSIKAERSKIDAVRARDAARAAELNKNVKSAPLKLAKPLFDSLASKKDLFDSKVPTQEDIQKHVDSNPGPEGYGSAKSKIDENAWGRRVSKYIRKLKVKFHFGTYNDNNNFGGMDDGFGGMDDFGGAGGMDNFGM